MPGRNGTKGERGERGQPGNVGQKGDRGPRGYKGKRGITGPRGHNGKKCEKGETGQPGSGQKGELPTQIYLILYNLQYYVHPPINDVHDILQHIISCMYITNMYPGVVVVCMIDRQFILQICT